MISDLHLERLRERLTEPRDDYHHGECPACEVALTQTDIDNEACTNCGAGLVDDESVDEDLVDDGCGDY